MKVDSSHKNDIESTLFPYRQMRFSCKYAGKPRIRVESKRPLQAYLACQCPVVARLKYDAKSQNYCLTKLFHEHNHTTSIGEFKHYMYTANRKLNDEQVGNVMAFIDLNVETKNIKSYIREKLTTLSRQKTYQILG